MFPHHKPMFFLLFLFIVVHYLIFRKYVTSVLDPILLPVISSVFSMADVYLLFFTNSISTYLFINFNLTQLAFWFGLFYFKTKINSKFNTLKTNTFSNNFNNTLSFYFFSIIYLCSQVLIYVTKGIPLLKESRLETFADGGGEGVLGRIVDVTSIFCLYSFFKMSSWYKTFKNSVSITNSTSFLFKKTKIKHFSSASR